MATYLVLAQSEVTAAALCAVVRCRGQSVDPAQILWNRPIEEIVSSIEAYESLAHRVEFAATELGAGVTLNDVVVLVDSVRPAGMSAVAEGGGWDAVVAMLVLTFPEVRWVAGVSSRVVSSASEESEGLAELLEHHSLESLFTKTRRECLFDPTGLREWVRTRTNQGIARVDDLRLPSRPDAAATIDEERPYAFWHAYIAYRFGYRADAVTSWALMKAQFDSVEPQSLDSKPHAYKLLLEDMSLNFADRFKELSLLRLSDRADWCKRLDSSNPLVEISEDRVLITTGQARPGDMALAENRTYLRAKATGKGRIVFKPTSGLFDLWEKCGLFQVRPDSRRRGNAEGFGWPPKPPSSATNASGHGAPGKLILISERLISRARTLLPNVRTLEEAVRGAVLATDALELSGSRTPTTAIDALSLKHQFEVLAECQFSGVEYHLSIGRRIEEIAVEVEAISLWFHHSRRTNAKLNAEMTILHALVRILRDYSQFDEEQICMSRIRHLHNTLWMRQSPLRNALWPLLRYLELLLSSFAVFVAIITLWVVGLSILFNEIADYNEWYAGVADTISSFFAVSGPMTTPATIDQSTVLETKWLHVLVSCVAIFGGFIHGGVFIAHLYSITSRK